MILSLTSLINAMSLDEVDIIQEDLHFTNPDVRIVCDGEWGVIECRIQWIIKIIHEDEFIIKIQLIVAYRS